MTPEQVLQLAQIAFVAILFVPSIVVIAIMIIVAWRVVPIVVRQSQQLIDNNAKLTKIVEQNEIKVAAIDKSLDDLTGILPELTKQTTALGVQTNEIRTQTLDFRSYQTLVSDNMSHHTAQLENNTAKTEANTAEVQANTAIIMALKAAMDVLPGTLIAAVQDELSCAALLREFQAFRFEVTQILSKQFRVETGTFPKVPTKPTTPQPEGGTG